MMAKGKQSDQKMKPYFVYQYLMRHSDASHVVTAKELEGYLQECGISAERRSIYKDIEEINKAILLTTTDKYGIEIAETIEEAEELLRTKQTRRLFMTNTARDITFASGIIRLMTYVCLPSAFIPQNSLMRSVQKDLRM